MRYFEMGLAFAAIGFIAAMTAGSLIAILLWRLSRARLQRSSSLFLLRMVPTLVSSIVVLGFIVPGYLLFEPRDTAERTGPGVAVLIAIAFGLAATGVVRGVKGYRATRRLERAWASVAQRSASLGMHGPVYRVPSDMPFAALVGFVHPRLFVADRFFDSLNATERLAVVRHEMGHLLAHDNLKRMAMHMAPDWLAFTATGRDIESAWAIAAEEAADDHAAGTDRARALDLASALLKAARHRPLRSMPVANFCDGSTIAGRTSRLLAGAPGRFVPGLSASARLTRALAVAGFLALLAGPACRATYALLEHAIRMLR
jgi:hypothetical protein